MNPITINGFPASFPIIAPTAELIGYIDDLNKGHDKIAVNGWTVADEVGLCSGIVRVSTTPTIERNDVAEIHPGLIKQGADPALDFTSR